MPAEEKTRRATVSCRFGAKCIKLDRKKHPEGCDWKHPQSHYAEYVPPAEGGGPAKKGKGGSRLASGATRAGEEDFVIREGDDSDDEDMDEINSMQAAGFRYMKPAIRSLKACDGSFEDRIAAMAACLGVPIESRSLGELPEDQFTLRARPRHAGYHASTRLVLLKLAVPLLLDSGATTSALMEEAVMAVIAEVMRAFQEDGLKQDDELYPIVRIYKYSDAASSPLSGVMAKAKTVIVHAITLRIQFVPEGQTTGPWRDIYFKILPAGSASLSTAGILGMPVLDRPPYGLGWRVADTTHVFDALGVALPRGELAARERYFKALRQDKPKSVKYKGKHEDELFALAEQFYSRSSPPNACLSIDYLHLSPGDQAVIPVRFDKPTPKSDFMLAPMPGELAVVDALPGKCGADVMEMSMCIENSGVVDVTLERGDVVATVATCSAPEPSRLREEGSLKDLGGAQGERGGRAIVRWGAIVLALLLASAAASAHSKRGAVLGGGC
jgi:hypothetical protein